MSTTPDPAVLRRLQKLLAMASDGRGNPAEAENAMRMAQKLMAAHGITTGALAADQIGEIAYVSSKTKNPPPYETALLYLLRKAFGCRHYWSPSYQHRGLGQWHIVAPKAQLELVRYAFDVVRRQLLKARAAYVATLPDHLSRMRKAAEGDAFGIAFVEALSNKVLALADVAPEIEQALEDRVQAVCKGHVGNPAKNLAFTHNALSAGREAGAQASLHRPMSGGRETLKLTQ